MKSQLNLKKALITVLFVIIGTAVFAQTGKISGTVTDKKTGETMIGVTIKIKGTTKGVTTDVEGRYVIGGLTVGKCTLVFSYIGYSSKEISDIEITANAATSLNVILEEATNQKLQEVVIKGSFKQESVNALYAQQKNSAAISDGISAEVIKKSPDRNTGEVLKRVSGASIQDNKFVIVRGLSDRYNSAMINNAPLPSSEPDRKTFAFDVIPSNLIDNVVISKTATPDLPGDFSGGSVQIKTRDFPVNRSLEINYGVGYNTMSTFKDFYGSPKSGLDYFAFGGSSRALPSSFPATAKAYSDASTSKKVAYTKQFDNSWGVGNLGGAAPTQNAQVIFGSTYELKNRGKLGLILSGTYRTSETISQEIRNDFNDIDPTTGKGLPFFNYNDNVYRFNTTVASLANIAYSRGTNKFALKTLFNQTFDDNYLNRQGTWDQEKAQKLSQQEVNDKMLLSTVLEGDHQISSQSKAKINWNLGFSRTTNNQPDLRRLSFSKPIAQLDDNSVPYQAEVPLGATSSTAGRFFSNLGENLYSASVNYTLPFKFLNESSTFKAGLSKQYKDRNVDARVLGYVTRADYNDGGRELLLLPQEQIFSEENIGANKFYLDDITNPTNSYDGTADLNSGYVMVNNVFFKKLKATWGLRVENYNEYLDTKLNTSTNGGNLNIENKYFDFLPSLNLTYELNAKTNLRFSYSNTIARAQFRELAPFTFYDFETGVTKIGNPELQRTKITNLDLRYEIYPSAGQMISSSVFYKSLTDPIENIIQSGSSAASKTMSYINAPNAVVYGIELEIRRNFEFINADSEFLKNLVFSANGAIVKSEVDFSGLDNSTIEDQRPLQGQSPYIINVGLNYSAPKSGWQTGLLYNRIGRRLSVVGFGRFESGQFIATYPDIYEAPRNLLDFQLSKRLVKNRAEVKLNVSNILDADANLYQNINEDKSYNSNTDQLINSIRYGRTFSLSFGYKF